MGSLCNQWREAPTIFTLIYSWTLLSRSMHKYIARHVENPHALRKLTLTKHSISCRSPQDVHR